MSYIITYYLPSGLFVLVSWISFLIPPDIVPGQSNEASFLDFLHHIVSSGFPSKPGIGTWYMCDQKMLVLLFFSFYPCTKGRMALLITLFLVLINIFNNVTTNSPKVIR
jgi:hypothetical protein